MRGKNSKKTTESEKKDLTFQSSQVIVRKKGVCQGSAAASGLRGGVSPACSLRYSLPLTTHLVASDFARKQTRNSVRYSRNSTRNLLVHSTSELRSPAIFI